MRILIIAGIAMSCTVAHAGEYQFESGLDLRLRDQLVLRTLTTPFDPADPERTYKVFTHVYDFDGEAPITKGAGGKFTHHRGLFIGWKDTLIAGEDYDTWHMSNCFQQHDAWLGLENGTDFAEQRERIRWVNLEGDTAIEETRTVRVQENSKGARIIDFRSDLVSKVGTILLRGDLQHAGMQIRMADEVSEHEETTEYLLPEGAEELDDDKVIGAWWVCAAVDVRGKRYWVMHMTPPDHPTGEPVYSIRRYARFGAFFEPDLQAGVPLSLRFRILVSVAPLSPADCAAHYATYAGSQP